MKIRSYLIGAEEMRFEGWIQASLKRTRKDHAKFMCVQVHTKERAPSPLRNIKKANVAG